MASDIPGMGYPSSLAMAKVLVTYMSCPHRVRDAILNEFDQAPGITTVERLRAEHLAPVAQEPICQSDVYRHDDASKAMDSISRDFLWRLDMERMASSRRAEVARRIAQQQA